MKHSRNRESGVQVVGVALQLKKRIQMHFLSLMHSPLSTPIQRGKNKQNGSKEVVFDNGTILVAPENLVHSCVIALNNTLLNHQLLHVKFEIGFVDKRL